MTNHRMKWDNARIVGPMINHFDYPFTQTVPSTSSQGTDECTMKFKSHYFMKQYMPIKPKKRQLKMWGRNDSETGYLFQFDLQTGRKENKKEA